MAQIARWPLTRVDWEGFLEEETPQRKGREAGPPGETRLWDQARRVRV